MAFLDPTERVKDRIAEIKRGGMDSKELSEREEAARAYAGEKEQHFVDYVNDCVETSRRAMEEIRKIQDECWRVYQEEEPPFYADKEPWQSRVVLSKPYGSVLYAKAITRKAFDTEFLSVDDRVLASNSDAIRFWEKLLYFQLSRRFANFSRIFSNATEMAYAVGTSMEMIPYWQPGRGLRFELVEPWKIHRDPDARSGDPQSGIYWVHEEWVDWFVLKEMAKKGRYSNLPDITTGGLMGEGTQSPGEIARRRGQFFEYGKFRTLVNVKEFWGQIVGPDGNLLLPDHTLTIAADKVISPPKRNPYKRLRWPGISFSPLPHLLRHDGRSLLQGVRSLWYFMCALLTLYNDNLNWIVNPPTEVNVDGLVDQTDLDDYPGKIWQTRTTATGHQVIRTVDRHSRTSDVLATLQFINQAYEEPPVPSNILKGLPGFRAEVTAREAAQQLNQSYTIYAVMGQNVEDGALMAIEAAIETIALNMTYDELVNWFGDDIASMFFSPMSRTSITLPEIDIGTFSVSGLSTLLKDEEVLRSIAEIVFPMSVNPVYAQYFDHYQVAKAIERRLNLKDEGLLIDQASVDAMRTQAAMSPALIGGEPGAVQGQSVQPDVAMLMNQMEG